MKKSALIAVLFSLMGLLLFSSFTADWGFFGHRRVNRLAVFTLPPEIISFYKKHIEYITEHAVDPDKRRYSTKHEAFRHYIDIDHWGEFPFENVPRKWNDALLKYTDIVVVNAKGDSIKVFDHELAKKEDGQVFIKSRSIQRKLKKDSLIINQDRYRNFFQKIILANYYEDAWTVSLDSIESIFGIESKYLEGASAHGIDNFSGYGIIPYHLLVMQNRLTAAFKKGNLSQILRVSAEFGHYIGDAHVPLHTTTNYNGKLTDQVGIHAFWESRIPELFADAEFDFFVGKADYIEDPGEFYWKTVLDSHMLVDSVLGIEKRLSRQYPEDQQYCYDDRLGRNIRTECREYAKAYADEMNGMVEDRMRASILALGSAWYTSWIDAGQPDLSKLSDYELTRKEQLEEAKLEEKYKKGVIKGREH